MSSSWFTTLECCFPQLSHAQRMARFKAASDEEHFHDDDSSTYSESDDSDYSTSSLDDDSDDDEEQDEALQQELLQKLKTRPGGTFVSAAVLSMLQNNIDGEPLPSHPVTAPRTVTKNIMMRRGSESATEATDEGATMASCVQTHLPTQDFSDEAKQSKAESSVSPSDKLLAILKARGVAPRIRASKDMADFFFQSNQSHIDAYDMQVMTAVRSGNVDALRVMHQQNKQLQCCNKFHESILHAAARRGGAPVLDFLLHEAQLQVKVCCATGRTPLHDACWTASPDFDAVAVILKACPDFLLISDNRNYTPLAYVPKDCWAAWCEFLELNQELLVPQTLL